MRRRRIVPRQTLAIRTADIVSQSVLSSGIVPPAERHDARILAESAVQGCVLVVSDDSHIRL